ncbi:hypothetical protein H257_07181 [Aphanomyces astaci]|uniref:Uncharacterized protein n=1 Tax=Aphanomyces astaci TaxID=112090 RepID=W4GKV7_APHAT|nr:hypothetical protein H257_07181 [Aphanomyces astaci]ETV79986.1 hypothetical protein H257_07181 [Aphanomyces astaci]KAF0775646.1 hypothetical protein AaE_000655 [Aphanomyces astaci]RQM22329.1 hypothetical protein B5M09_008879 [Aphanomyces astaci]|eukprot:XP_009830922.1 hypothetical protein H257_07181 [Aphanomyces astaci]
MDAHILACVRGQVVTSARFLDRSPYNHKKQPEAYMRERKATEVEPHTWHSTEAPSAMVVLTSRDLLCAIATYQNGLFPTLLPVFTSGHWMSTFADNEFVAMHLGPHGRVREALLHCILLDNLDLLRLLLRCFPRYPTDDYRFHEVVDAAIALNRPTMARFLMHLKPRSRCISRALSLAVKNGHAHILDEFLDGVDKAGIDVIRP